MKWHQHKRSKYGGYYNIYCNPFKYPIVYYLYYPIYNGIDLKETYKKYIKKLYEK